MEEKNDLLENLQGLDPDTLAILSGAQITKVGQLLQLQQEPDELGLLSCGVPLIELVDACDAAVSQFSARRQLESRPTETICTSLPDLNEALGGGLLRGGITVFNGNSKCLTLVTRLVARHKCKLIIVGGGSGARVSQFQVRDDAVAMEAIGGVSSDVIIIDGISRLITPALCIRSEARTKVRGTVCKISAALRTLATDANLSVVIISAEEACTSFDRMWEHVVDARVEFGWQSSTKEDEENDAIIEEESPVSRDDPNHYQALITRKNGDDRRIDVDMKYLL